MSRHGDDGWRDAWDHPEPLQEVLIYRHDTHAGDDDGGYDIGWIGADGHWHSNFASEEIPPPAGWQPLAARPGWQAAVHPAPAPGGHLRNLLAMRRPGYQIDADLYAADVEQALHAALREALTRLGYSPAGLSAEALHVRTMAYDRLHALLLRECPRAYQTAALASQQEPTDAC